MTIRFNPPLLAFARNADTFIHIASEILEPEIAGELHVIESRPHAKTRLVLIVSGRPPVCQELPPDFLQRGTSEEAMRQAVSSLLDGLPAHRG
jgi:hypothetical protein